jgi:hypothetical protein
MKEDGNVTTPRNVFMIICDAFYGLQSPIAIVILSKWWLQLNY